ncbi:hypothetical protein QZH41_019159, partial [Actinostola sp. cb2023]
MMMMIMMMVVGDDDDDDTDNDDGGVLPSINSAPSTPIAMSETLAMFSYPPSRTSDPSRLNSISSSRDEEGSRYTGSSGSFGGSIKSEKMCKERTNSIDLEDDDSRVNRNEPPLPTASEYESNSTTSDMSAHVHKRKKKFPFSLREKTDNVRYTSLPRLARTKKMSTCSYSFGDEPELNEIGPNQICSSPLQATDMANRLDNGDEKVTDEELEALRNTGKPAQGGSNMAKRNAMRDRARIWRTRRIPYVIDSAIQAAVVSTISNAIQTFSTITCVKWEAKTAADTKYIKFVKKDGCWSWVGKTTSFGAQELSVGDGCNYVATIIHEMMHASGFFHEQSRPDRDTYVTINWNNIMDGQSHNFNKKTPQESEIFGVYDYDSVMHYGRTDFSKNSNPTIQAINDANKALGQNIGLSELDIVKIKTLYDCSSPSGNAWSSWSLYGPCKLDFNSNCMEERQRFCTVESMAGCTGVDADGVQRESRACTSSAGCVENTHSCTFEVDTCGWQNEGTNAQSSSDGYYDWVDSNAASESSATGPSADHTASGSYYFVNKAYTFNAGSIGAVAKSGFNATGGACLDFWYHMKGADMGTLKVYLKTSSRSLQWSVSGNQGTAWLNKRMTLSSAQSFS